MKWEGAQAVKCHKGRDRAQERQREGEKKGTETYKNEGGRE